MQSIFQRVAQEAGEKLVSKSDLAELKRLQADWECARETISGTGVDSAYACWLGEQQRATLAAKGGTLREFRSHSREELENDFLRKGEAAREHQRQVTASAVPLCRRTAEKFAETAHQVAAKVEKSEAALFAEWGVAYVPSGLVMALRQLADRARNLIPRSQFAQTSPASMLPFLNIN